MMVLDMMWVIWVGCWIRWVIWFFWMKMMMRNDGKGKSVKIFLKGVVGFMVYGLNYEGFDVDYFGVFVVLNREILGFGKVQEFVNIKDFDMIMYEVKKFVQFCLNGNLLVFEILWFDVYEQIDEFGVELVCIRYFFFLLKKVWDFYFGYVVSQFFWLKNWGDGLFFVDICKWIEKYVWYFVCLVEQGYYLYWLGELVVNLCSSVSEMILECVFELGWLIVQDFEYGEKYMWFVEVRFDWVCSLFFERFDVVMVENWLLWVWCWNWSWV